MQKVNAKPPVKIGMRRALKTASKNAVSQASCKDRRSVRAISVSSGKGGVGKSSVVVNLAIAFDRLGQRVLIIDGDLGLANIHVLLGLSPQYSIRDVLEGRRTLEEVLIAGPGRIRILPAISGKRTLTRFTDEQKLIFLEMLDGLETEIDVLLIDTGAGISDTVLYFNLAAQEKIIVVNSDPASIADAYTLIETLFTKYRERHFGILANGVRGARAGKDIFSKLCKAADHLMDGLSLDYLGSIPHDPCVHQAVIEQHPVMEAFPEAPSAAAFMRVAEGIRKAAPNTNHGTIRFFRKHILNA